MDPQTHTLTTPDVDLVYDVRGPLPTTDGRPVLLMAGHPMQAGGFEALADLFPDRTVVTYDPRGTGRSARKDGQEDRGPDLHAADLHVLIEHLGGGPVDLFGSSGGAVNGLTLVETHPDDVRVLVAHEPPLLRVLPDADQAVAAERAVQASYNERGFGAGMAHFVALTSWRGEITQGFVDQPGPDPAQFGMPADDDGSRDDPLLSGTANAITSHELDVDTITAAPTRVVVAVGVESADTLTGRTSVRTSEILGRPLVEFPSHHGGFLGGESPYRGEPEAFAARLREVLDHPP